MKTKRAGVHPARDLYSSPLWRARRGYADNSRLPWFAVSALHGLVGPDEPLATYDLALHDIPNSRRRDWAQGVVIELERRVGSLEGRAVEIHAGGTYRTALTPVLLNCGALVESPTAAIRGVGNQIAWYASAAGAPRRRPSATTRREEAVIPPAPLELADLEVIDRQRPATICDVAAALDALDRDPYIVSASNWPSGLNDLDRPGLYSWWVDAHGAEMLSRGLGHAVAPGRIYAGLTGATKWPSGKTGKNTLRKRLRGHIRGRIRGSTFRLALASVLRDQLALVVEAPKVMSRASEQALTTWIAEHLAVAVHPVADPDTLADLETRVLSQIDPPLNLDKRPINPLRARLTELRAGLSAAR